MFSSTMAWHSEWPASRASCRASVIIATWNALFSQVNVENLCT